MSVFYRMNVSRVFPCVFMETLIMFACLGVTIEEFHSEWKTDYRKLERIHSYIQW